MAYTLKMDEILEALLISNHHRAQEYQSQVEALCDAMAQALANEQGVICGAASFEGTGFCGTACTFQPSAPGQPIPACMEGYDNGEEWEVQ